MRGFAAVLAAALIAGGLASISACTTTGRQGSTATTDAMEGDRQPIRLAGTSLSLVVPRAFVGRSECAAVTGAGERVPCASFPVADPHPDAGAELDFSRMSGEDRTRSLSDFREILASWHDNDDVLVLVPPHDVTIAGFPGFAYEVQSNIILDPGGRSAVRFHRDIVLQVEGNLFDCGLSARTRLELKSHAKDHDSFCASVRIARRVQQSPPQELE